MRAPALLVIASLALGGCWKTELNEVPVTTISFEPGIVAPQGWLVTPFEVDLNCPDGEDARFYLLYPESAAVDDTGGAPAPTTSPLPAAVVYHSGAFDFVFAPNPEEPLAGTHYATPSRLDHGWAIRHVFATFGMLPNEVEAEQHTGALPVALAERGVPMLFPTNCWGDMWHNRRGLADNDFPADLFARDGRTAAEWGYQFLTDPLFAAAFDVELPISVDPDQVYVIGLGTGGRAVGELLTVDTDDDGVPDHAPAGALVDSHPDDLRIYFDDPALYGNTVAGLSRIFPGGRAQTVPGSLFDAPLPPRFGYLYSSADPLVPVDTHGAVVSRLLGEPDRWIYVDDQPGHVLLNGDDLQLARDAVAFLIDGAAPPMGPGAPVGGDDTGAY